MQSGASSISHGAWKSTSRWSFTGSLRGAGQLTIWINGVKIEPWDPFLEQGTSHSAARRGGSDHATAAESSSDRSSSRITRR